MCRKCSWDRNLDSFPVLSNRPRSLCQFFPCPYQQSQMSLRKLIFVACSHFVWLFFAEPLRRSRRMLHWMHRNWSRKRCCLYKQSSLLPATESGMSCNSPTTKRNNCQKNRHVLSILEKIEKASWGNIRLEHSMSRHITLRKFRSQLLFR